MMNFIRGNSFDTEISSENREDNYSSKNIFSFDSSTGKEYIYLKDDIVYKHDFDYDRIVPEPLPSPIIHKKNIKFQTKREGRGQRGQRSKYPQKRARIHDNTEFDNLLRKIQVHFLSFVINISNDAILAEFNDTKNNFKDISYEIKKIVNYQTCSIFKNYTVKNILCQKISSKYKKFDQYINRQTLNEVCKSEWLNKFYNMKFMDIFEIYHSNGKELKEFEFENKTIKLSKSTKTFFNLLNKKENIPIRDKLIETLSIVYYNGYDKHIKSNSFISEKNQDE